MDRFTILFLLNATPAWLSLSRKERSDFFAQTLLPIVNECAEDCKVRFYDSEYFHASVSDYMIIDTTNLNTYQLFIERMRDTLVYGVPYFEVKEIIVGQENAFQRFDKMIK